MKKLSLTQIAIVIIGIVLLVRYVFLPFPNHVRLSPVRRAQMEISIVQTALKSYQDVYGKYPDGDRPRVLKRLLGENPQRIQFLNIAQSSVNDRGEYVDPWKTPYQINFSTDGFVIASAGKDRSFETGDDIVFNSASNDFVKP